MKTIFQKWINFILDHPKWIIGCTVFITIAMIYFASQLKMDFSIEGKDIRFGLTSIKGIAEKSIKKLESFKDQYSNKFEVFLFLKNFLFIFKYFL